MSHRTTVAELATISTMLTAVEMATNESWTVAVDERWHKVTGEYEMHLTFRSVDRELRLGIAGSESRGYDVETDQVTQNYPVFDDAANAMGALVRTSYL